MCIVFWYTCQDGPYKLVLASNRDEHLERVTKRADWWEFPHSDILAPRDLQAKVSGTWIGISKRGRIATLTNSHVEDTGNGRPIAGSGGSNSNSPGNANAPSAIAISTKISPTRPIHKLNLLGSPVAAAAGSPTTPAATHMLSLSSPPSRGILVRDFLEGVGESPLAYLQGMVQRREAPTYAGFNLLVGDLCQPTFAFLSNRSSTEPNVVRATPVHQVQAVSNGELNDPEWPRVQRGSLIFAE
ncbi:NRDE protein-domain-containing protein, partial [Dimargaris cristalligena]